MYIINYLCGNRVYFEAKILHKMKAVCGTLSHKMDELILRKHQVDGTQLLIYIYIRSYVYK